EQGAAAESAVDPDAVHPPRVAGLPVGEVLQQLPRGAAVDHAGRERYPRLEVIADVGDVRGELVAVPRLEGAPFRAVAGGEGQQAGMVGTGPGPVARFSAARGARRAR